MLFMLFMNEKIVNGLNSLNIVIQQEKKLIIKDVLSYMKNCI